MNIDGILSQLGPSIFGYIWIGLWIVVVVFNTVLFITTPREEVNFYETAMYYLASPFLALMIMGLGIPILCVGGPIWLLMQVLKLAK